MASILVRFWFKRFALVFLIACAALGAIEWIREGASAFDGGSVLAWSAIAALCAASIGAYWAWKRQCRQVFGDAD